MELEKSHVEVVVKEEENTMEDNMKKQKKAAGSGKRGGWGGGNGVCCQAEKCTVDMTESKRYYRRHKVCDFHAKELSVMVSGLRQRFCQQCSRFHELSEFDDIKRSCRRRLAGHNERRRRAALEQQLAEGSSSNRANPELGIGGPQTM